MIIISSSSSFNTVVVVVVVNNKHHRTLQTINTHSESKGRKIKMCFKTSFKSGQSGSHANVKQEVIPKSVTGNGKISIPSEPPSSPRYLQ